MLGISDTRLEPKVENLVRTFTLVVNQLFTTTTKNRYRSWDIVADVIKIETNAANICNKHWSKE